MLKIDFKSEILALFDSLALCLANTNICFKLAPTEFLDLPTAQLVV